VRRQIGTAESTSPLAGLAGNPEAPALWPGLGLGRQRAVLRMLADVTLAAHAKPGPGGFDPATVLIEWKR
jgi:hypothetical protein